VKATVYDRLTRTVLFKGDAGDIIVGDRGLIWVGSRALHPQTILILYEN